jgi:transcriptional regulator with XRE-family HTH domain
MSMPVILTTSRNIRNSLEGLAGSHPAGYNEHVDFPHALRERRARRHLSQLDLALRAGTTQRHVSFIESGRSAPGRNIVVRLAESLELPLRERNELLLAAGYAPAYPESSLDDPALARCAPRSATSSRVISLTRRSSWTETGT